MEFVCLISLVLSHVLLTLAMMLCLVTVEDFCLCPLDSDLNYYHYPSLHSLAPPMPWSFRASSGLTDVLCISFFMLFSLLLISSCKYLMRFACSHDTRDKSEVLLFLVNLNWRVICLLKAFSLACLGMRMLLSTLFGCAIATIYRQLIISFIYC